MMARLLEGSTTGSISVGSLHDDVQTDIAEIQSTPVNVRKRKRRSFQESPEGPIGEFEMDIFDGQAIVRILVPLVNWALIEHVEKIARKSSIHGEHLMPLCTRL